jgi:ubiquitin carboxyl-terminal hydrolase 10
LAEALIALDNAEEDSKVAFLEPRGLKNTGNMCYMNSVSHIPLDCDALNAKTFTLRSCRY